MQVAEPAAEPALAPWYPSTAWRIHVALVCLTAAASILVVLGKPTVTTSAAIMAIAVALLGLPHGAYDLRLARDAFRPILPRAWLPFFVCGYIALAALALGFWLLVPIAGLVTLLVLGAAHWGADDLQARTGHRVADIVLFTSRGALPVALPMLFHPQQTAEIFNALLGSRIANEDNVFFAGLISLVIACPAIVIGAVIAPPGGRVREVTEIAVLLAWFAAAGPILAFTLYFCLWHALRHSLRSMARTGEPTLATAIRRYARDVWAPTLGTIILASLAVPFLASCDTPASLIWRIVFVGLFALTVPHVLLEFRNERRPR